MMGEGAEESGTQSTAALAAATGRPKEEWDARRLRRVRGNFQRVEWNWGWVK